MSRVDGRAELSAKLALAREAPDSETKQSLLSDVIAAVTKRQRALLPVFFGEIFSFLVSGRLVLLNWQCGTVPSICSLSRVIGL
jgi:hypothetical protein